MTCQAMHSRYGPSPRNTHRKVRCGFTYLTREKRETTKKKRKKGGGEEEMNICLERRIKGTRIKLHGKFTLLFDKRKEYVE